MSQLAVSRPWKLFSQKSLFLYIACSYELAFHDFIIILSKFPSLSHYHHWSCLHVESSRWLQEKLLLVIYTDLTLGLVGFTFVDFDTGMGSLHSVLGRGVRVPASLPMVFVARIGWCRVFTFMVVIISYPNFLIFAITRVTIWYTAFLLGVAFGFSHWDGLPILRAWVGFRVPASQPMVFSCH